MIIVYGIANCNTVKKSIQWLQQHNLLFEFHDYKKKGIEGEKLKEWCEHFGWESVLNKKGTTWSSLSEEQQSAIKDITSAIEYLIENTSAIKRPK